MKRDGSIWTANVHFSSITSLLLKLLNHNYILQSWDNCYYTLCDVFHHCFIDRHHCYMMFFYAVNDDYFFCRASWSDVFRRQGHQNSSRQSHITNVKRGKPSNIGNGCWSCLNMVDLLFLQFILVQMVFVQPHFVQSTFIHDLIIIHSVFVQT